tara:strand:+ start:124 stop:243 length:120 start_codon:yes stop_codon:yes gene_type:complete
MKNEREIRNDVADRFVIEGNYRFIVKATLGNEERSIPRF